MTDASAADGGRSIDWTGGGSPDPPGPEPASDPGPEHEDDAADGAPDDDVGEQEIPDDIADLEATVQVERDEYLERLQRLQAEFENYRKRMTKEQAEAMDRGSQRLALDLLAVLDGCEGALQQGRDDVGPIHAQLLESLVKAGLERYGEPGDGFDPERHEAVMHEPAEEGAEGGEESTIAEVLRTGYSWKGRVLRPAMVKVRG